MGRQPMNDLVHHRVTHIVERDLGKRLAQERLDQKVSRQGLGNSPRAHIKQRGFIQLAGRRPVRTLDVIGVNLQFRLGIHLGPVGEQQCLCKLVAVGALGVGMDNDAPLKDAPGLII